jgi:hypothetical protein
MTELLSRLLTWLSEFFSSRKGLLPILAVVLIILNFILRFLPPDWFNQTDFFLHLGLIIAIFGFMLAWAL